METHLYLLIAGMGLIFLDRNKEVFIVAVTLMVLSVANTLSVFLILLGIPFYLAYLTALTLYIIFINKAYKVKHSKVTLVGALCVLLGMLLSVLSLITSQYALLQASSFVITIGLELFVITLLNLRRKSLKGFIFLCLVGATYLSIIL